jgi:hypothetical protein
MSSMDTGQTKEGGTSGRPSMPMLALADVGGCDGIC